MYDFARTSNSHGQKVLRKAIQKTLTSLGANAGSALVWHLHNEGFSINSEPIDIDYFYECLHKILGEGGEVVIGMIFQEICKLCIVENAWFSEDMPPVEKIHVVVAVLNKEVSNYK